MCVRSASGLAAAAALKVIAAKKNTFCSFKDSSTGYLIKNVVFDNFIKLLYI